MALGVRELLLIIRARDEATRAIHRIGAQLKTMDEKAYAAAQQNIARGTALTSLGIGIAAVGAAGLKFLYDSTQAAVAYNQEAAKTATQLDKVKGSVEDLKRIGREVAEAIPVPFEQTQESLYDIFSSMDVSMAQSQRLLAEFSKAAVAGQVQLRDASRATIGILNAYHMSADKVNLVNDVMFQLVRKGVGTYGQFATTIGRAVPSAVRAGQSIQDLAGMLAFLTRNGLSTAMASASAARALDSMSNPKVVGRLEKMGVAVRNAKGEFRPISSIVEQLGKKMQGLTAPERAKALQELFKGAGGTIQARRFWDIALRNYDELNKRTKEMKNSAGALQGAYDIMFKQPQSQIQLMSNRFKVMQTIIGDNLIPVLLTLTTFLSKIFLWFSRLSPGIRKAIVYTLVITSALAVLAGGITAIVGIIMIFVGTLAILEITFASIAIAVGIVVGAIIALGVIVFLVVKYHKQIWAAIKSFWGIIVDFYHRVVDTLIRAWHTFLGALQAIWHWIRTNWPLLLLILIAPFAAAAWIIYKQWDRIVDFFKKLPGRLVHAMDILWDLLYRFFFTVFLKTIRFIVQKHDEIVSWFLRLPGRIIHAMIDLVPRIFDFVRHVFNRFMDAARAGAQEANDYFDKIPSRLLHAIGNLANTLFQTGKDLIGGFFRGIKSAWTSTVDWFKGLPSKILHALGMSPPPDWAIEGGKKIMVGLLKGIIPGGKTLLSYAKNVVSNFTATLFADPTTGATRTWATGGVVDLGEKLAKQLKGWVGSQWRALYILWQNESGWNPKADNPTSTAFGIPQFLASTARQYGVFGSTNPAAQIAAGMQYISDVYGNPVNALNAWRSRHPHWYRYGGWINEPIMGIGRSGRMYGFGEAGPEKVTPAGEVGGVTQTINIYTQEIDPRKHAAELGWELVKGVA